MPLCLLPLYYIHPSIHCEGRLPPSVQARPHWLTTRLTFWKPPQSFLTAPASSPRTPTRSAPTHTAQTSQPAGIGDLREVPFRCAGGGQCGVLAARTAHHSRSAKGSNPRTPPRRRRSGLCSGARRRGTVTLGLWGEGSGETCLWPSLLDRLMAFKAKKPSPLGCLWR